MKINNVLKIATTVRGKCFEATSYIKMGLLKWAEAFIGGPNPKFHRKILKDEGVRAF